jgi:dTDP-glucose 4,6-dehydratase
VKQFPEARFVFFDKMTYSADIDNIVQHLQDRRHQLVVGDICDPDSCRVATAEADLVIHAAAESHVDRSFMNATRFVLTNVFGTHTLLDACRLNQVPRIIHVSTDEVYGEVLEGQVDEAAVLNPTNPYSASKAAAEMMVRSLIHCYRMPILMVRGNNIYGARQYPEKIIARFCLGLIRGEKLPVHGNGRNVRHYLAAQDMAEAIALINRVGEVGQIYNIGSDEEYTNLQVTRMICDAFGVEMQEVVEFVEDRPFNDRRYSISSRKLRSLGWAPRRRLADEIPAIAQWYRDNAGRYEWQRM